MDKLLQLFSYSPFITGWAGSCKTITSKLRLPVNIRIKTLLNGKIIWQKLVYLFHG